MEGLKKLMVQEDPKSRATICRLLLSQPTNTSFSVDLCSFTNGIV